MHNVDPTNSLKERGMRLKLLREHIGDKRQDFAKKLGITRVTLSYWENASTIKSGLHEEGARKVIEIAKKVGIICTLPWLLYGIGEAPYATDDDKIVIDGLACNKQREIDLFLASTKSTVITSIPDSSMSPIFETGDIVGGVWQPSDSIDIFDKTYIVEIDKVLQVRKIRKSPDKNLYDIYSVTYTPDLKIPFEIKNLVLNRIAPVIRLWR